jgi:hypothetical protein
MTAEINSNILAMLKHEKLSFHPASELFPLMDGPEYDALVQDIKVHGLKQRIITHKNQILDGRNRFRACCDAGTQIYHWNYEEYSGKQSPTDFVVSLNLHRRHLSESQRAMVAAKIATLQLGNNQHASNEAPTQTEAAKLLNVSRSNVQRARKVIASGNERIIAAVDKGALAVSKAARIVESPKEIIQITANKTTGPCIGMMHADNAIRQLEKISPIDMEHHDALDLVAKWVLEKLMKDFDETPQEAFHRWIEAVQSDADSIKLTKTNGGAQ